MWKETLDQFKDWRLLLGPLPAVISLNPGVESPIAGPPALEITGATVVDGLESFRKHELSEAHTRAGVSAGQHLHNGVYRVDLLMTDKYHVRVLSPLSPDLGVHQLQMLRAAPVIEPPIRRFGTKTRVSQVPMLKTSDVPACRTADCAIPESKIREATPRIRTFPHIRRAIDIHSIGGEVAESYLREAEAGNGIPCADAEILAVFRNVPISMISRFRILEERGVLLYTLAPPQNASRAQVHEVAAVRDKVRKVTCLVAHRSRYNTARIA